MSDNTKYSQSGFTVAELLITTAIAGIVLIAISSFMLSFYGGIIATNTEAKLAVESQAILQNIVEELRVSSGVRATNTITDTNAPGGAWTTSNDDLILIISTPVLNDSNDFETSPVTGSPYQNEIVYFAQNGALFKRTLANTNAAENDIVTSCPQASSTPSCPPDVKMTDNFEDMSFEFYDQDDVITSDLPTARSIKLTIDMLKKTYGRTITFRNTIRITLRNTTL